MPDVNRVGLFRGSGLAVLVAFTGPEKVIRGKQVVVELAETQQDYC